MKTLGALAIVMFASVPAAAVELTVLSAGAVEPGLHAFAEVAKRETGHSLAIRFNTGPQIAKRLADGEAFDILISPPPALAQAQKDGQVLADTKTPVGRVGAGVVVKAGAPLPDVSSVDALKRAVLAADAIAYNTASTGIYLDKLFAQLGILDALKAKTTRYPDGASVMEHVRNGKGRDIAFGAITEILLYKDKGLRFVGPLPADVQNYTPYVAALTPQGNASAAARDFVAFLATPQSRRLFAGAGVE